ncbi:MAG: hypothetical protein AAF579_22450 [Cyanobacteria bacterium P01_C01_bin.118]
MDNFYRYSLSRQDLNTRAAHSLCRAGWMLAEINGVLQNGSIKPASFAMIQQQAATLDQLQRKFGPPPTLSASTDTQTLKVQARKTITIRVMNRGVEAAAAVLTHHGWHYSQINDVLKSPITPLENLGPTLMSEQPATVQTMYHYPLRPQTVRSRSHHSVGKTLLVLFWFGGLIFVGVSLMLHML